MNCIILFRINGGPVQAVTSMVEVAECSVELICEFPNLDAAVAFATDDGGENRPFNRLIESGQADYQIVELNEL